MPKKKSSPHDRLFKETFSNRNEAIQFFKFFLPPDLSRYLDFRTLKIQHTSFVSERLATYFADIVYSCKWKNSEKEALLTFLLEHKSYSVKYPHLQLLRYQLEGYESQLKQQKELSLIIPVILYHGKNKWNARPFDEYFQLPHPLFLRFVPSFDYILANLNEYADEELMAIGMDFLVASLLLFKHKQDKNFVLNNYRKLFIFVENSDYQPETNRYLETLILYIFQSFDIEKKEIEEILDDLPQHVATMFTSTYDKAVKSGLIKGEAIGMQKGEAIGMQKGEAIGMQKGEAIGMQKGEAVGIQKGELIGVQKGELLSKIDTILRLFTKTPVLNISDIHLITQIEEPIIFDLKHYFEEKQTTLFKEKIVELLERIAPVTEEDYRRIKHLIKF